MRRNLAWMNVVNVEPKIGGRTERVFIDCHDSVGAAMSVRVIGDADVHDPDLRQIRCSLGARRVGVNPECLGILQ